MGWFVNTIAWLRLGDAYRAWVFSKDTKGGFYWGLGTLLAERMLDMITVALMIVAAVLAATVTTDNAILRYLVIATAGSAAVFFALLVAMRLFGLRLARLLPSALERIYGQFHQGSLGSIEARNLPLLAALSVMGWALEAARLYFVVQALDLSLSIPDGAARLTGPRRAQHGADPRGDRCGRGRHDRTARAQHAQGGRRFGGCARPIDNAA